MLRVAIVRELAGIWKWKGMHGLCVDYVSGSLSLSLLKSFQAASCVETVRHSVARDNLTRGSNLRERGDAFALFKVLCEW